MTFDYEKFDQEQYAWEKKNFGYKKGNEWHPLLGIQEELGELAHAHLKYEQEIRVDEDHEAARRDAIGDVAIYITSYLHYAQANVAEVFGLGKALASEREDRFDGTPHGCIQSMQWHLGWVVRFYQGAKADTNHFFTANQQQSLAFLVAALHRYAEQTGLNFETVLAETWAEVKQRDWTKNKVDGMAE